MSEIQLPALNGRNPLGLFAALGALDVCHRRLPAGVARLRWLDDLQPTAVLEGPDSVDHLVELCDQDREAWLTSSILTWGPDGTPIEDLKPHPDDLRSWIRLVHEEYLASGDRRDIDLLAALVAEGATSGKGETKPTHFHFTAGQQRFLTMVRELCREVDATRLREALVGPWRYDSPLPVLGWDGRGERIYALRGVDPAKEKKLGVPGADWLAFIGLRFFPVTVGTTRAGRGQLVTTGCSAGWKRGTFTWPLWGVPLSTSVIASLVADRHIVAMTPADRAALGVFDVVQAPIRRTDQGGYGSFGPTGSPPPSPPRSEVRT